MTKPDSFTFFFTNVAWKISQQESVCVCVAQRTTAAHIACLTPAHLCLQQFVGSGNSKVAPIVICKMFVCICVFFRVMLWGVVCVLITKRNQTQINQWEKMKINKRKWSNESGKSIISGQGSLFPWRELTAGWGRGKILWLLSPLLAPPPPPPLLLLPTKHNSGRPSVTTKRWLQSKTRLCVKMLDWQQ